MSSDDFFSGVTVSFASPVTPVVLPHKNSRRPMVVAVLVALALVAGLVVLVWPSPSKPARPDVPTARLFGQETRVQLPPPVTADECSSAVHAFPAIDHDARARAAFVDGCLHGG